jgi:hypothetical protein
VGGCERRDGVRQRGCGCVAMTRVCPCLRKCSMEGRRSDAIWASEACAKRWQREHPGLPLSAARSTDVSPTNRKKSGLQVSYLRLVKELRARPDDDPVDVANDCMSDLQRAQLHAREQRKAA